MPALKRLPDFNISSKSILRFYKALIAIKKDELNKEDQAKHSFCKDICILIIVHKMNDINPNNIAKIFKLGKKHEEYRDNFYTRLHEEYDDIKDWNATSIINYLITAAAEKRKTSPNESIFYSKNKVPRTDKNTNKRRPHCQKAG